jgi:HSP20 family molecular chaperone IbpA
LEDNQLVIRGRKNENEDETDRVYLHRGIAARQFQRMFVLADGIEVTGADLDNGLLHIDLVRQVPEPEIRTVNIVKGSSAGKKRDKPSQTIDVAPE